MSLFASFTPCRPAQDAWSLGALLFALYFRRPLFMTRAEAVAEAALPGWHVKAVSAASSSSIIPPQSQLQDEKADDALSSTASLMSSSSSSSTTRPLQRWSARRPRVWSHVRHSSLVDLLESLLVHSSQRLSMAQILSHPYLTQSQSELDESAFWENDQVWITSRKHIDLIALFYSSSCCVDVHSDH